MHAIVLIVAALLPVHECAYHCQCKGQCKGQCANCCTAIGTECSSADRTFSYELACTANLKCFQRYWDVTDTPASLTSHVSRLQPPQFAEIAWSLGVAHSNKQGVGFGKGLLVHMLMRLVTLT